MFEVTARIYHALIHETHQSQNTLFSFMLQLCWFLVCLKRSSGK